jgi:hypothetical protein
MTQNASRAQGPKFASFNWMRGIVADKRISIVHRLVLIRIFLHRRNDSGVCEPGYDTVAGELGVDRATIFRAVDAGTQCGWIAPFEKHGGRVKRNFLFTFPVDTSAQQSQQDRQQSHNTATVQQTQQSHQEQLLTVAETAPNSRRNGTTPYTGRINREKKREKSQTLAPDLFESEDKQEERREKKKKGAARKPRVDLDEAFESFWAVYPRKVAKEAARRAHAKAVENGVEPETLIAGAQRYAVERQGEPPRYTKHPATWLNGGCWLDEPVGTPVIDQDGNIIAIEQEEEEEDRSNWGFAEWAEYNNRPDVKNEHGW